MTKLEREQEKERFALSLADYSKEELEEIATDWYMVSIPEKIPFKSIDDKVYYIINSVCEYLNIDRGLIVGQSRKLDVVFARHLAIALIRRYTNLSQTRTGSFFSHRDHSTIHHAEHCIADYEDSPLSMYRAKREVIFHFVEDFNFTL